MAVAVTLGLVREIRGVSEGGGVRYDGLYPREKKRLLDAYDLHVHFMYALGTKRNIISWSCTFCMIKTARNRQLKAKEDNMLDDNIIACSLKHY